MLADDAPLDRRALALATLFTARTLTSPRLRRLHKLERAMEANVRVRR
jgi:hypothetical protein